MTRSQVLCVAFLLLAGAGRSAQDVPFLSLPPGYVAGKVPLGTSNYATALAPDPADENYVYVAGMFGGRARIVRLDLWNAQRTTVFTCPTSVTVSGFAVYNAGGTYAILVSDNQHDRLWELRDSSPMDGVFDAWYEFIRPILTNPGGDWTGSAVLILTTGSTRLHLPAKTALFQSEDGGTTQGEVLAVTGFDTRCVPPEKCLPSFQPPNGAYFSGFNYGGGIVLDSQGRLLVASSFYPATGKVWICEDLNQNGVIGAGESNILVARASNTTESAGLSALAIDSADRCYVSVGWGFGATVRTQIQRFKIPANPLRTTATVTTFATLRSPYVSAAVFNSPVRLFEPFVSNGAILVIVANDSFYGNLDYLLTVRPSGKTGVRAWRLY